MTDYGQPHAHQIDTLWIVAVGERYQRRHREHVSAVKGRRDPSRIGVGKSQLWCELREQGGPEECIDLDQHLGCAYKRHQTSCGRVAGTGGILQAVPRTCSISRSKPTLSPIAVLKAIYSRFCLLFSRPRRPHSRPRHLLSPGPRSSYRHRH